MLTSERKLMDGVFYANIYKTAKRNEKGTLVFANTDLSIFQIGSMLANGETKNQVLAEYDYLTVDDLKFAKMYYFNVLKQPDSQKPSAVDTFRQIAERKQNAE